MSPRPRSNAHRAATTGAAALLLAASGLGCGTVLGLDDLVADRVECAGPCGTPGCGSCPDSAMVDVSCAGQAFRIDVHEVTNAEYQAFVATSPSVDGQRPQCTWNDSYAPGVLSQAVVDTAMAAGLPVDLDPSCSGFFEQQLAAGGGDRAVACIDWCDAAAYCAWGGKRLCGKVGGGTIDTSNQASAMDPATNEWLCACSAEGALTYPYGNAYVNRNCNDAGTQIEPVGTQSGCEGGVAGLQDMSGNVEEWYDGCTNFNNPPEHQNCNRNGGAYWADETLLACNLPREILPFIQSNATGFRCCADP